MLEICGGCDMYFAGSDAPCAFLEISLFGSAGSAAYAKATEAFTNDVVTVLGLPSDKIYIKYEETENWGWSGRNF